MRVTRGLHEGYKVSPWVTTLPPYNPVTDNYSKVMIG